MEQQQIKVPRVLRMRSKREIIDLLQQYEASKNTISLFKFCRAHDVPHATFYSWQKKRREGKRTGRGRFMELSLDTIEPVKTEAKPGLFASFSSAGLTIEFHQYVSPDYIKALLTKQERS